MHITTMDKYLESSEIIDSDNTHVRRIAFELANGMSSREAIAKSCFEYVRDKIKHSKDHQLNPVTCTASEVLIHGTGYCYSKSHLLAALLRANGIPAGICYQRLTIDHNKPPFCLHALNAVYLEETGWYRMDARGDKEGVRTAFAPPVEKLAFSIDTPGEADLPEIWPEPLPQVIRVLRSSNTFQDVADNFPDIDLIGTCSFSRENR
ncbi:MAG TPA: transglutaminase family protein [Syntrophorhabdaceae bacterium]|nr:transglutaminase family protein [Syntrophorhabdaceae bacterium]